MTQSEKMLIAAIKASNLEVCALFLQGYIQRNGPVSNEAGDEIKKILAEKQKKKAERKEEDRNDD